jgi:hypothetical protein
MAAIPSEAQTWRYTRGLLSDSPLEHDDALALRTFCHYTGDAWCVVIRPTVAWTLRARGGWRATGPRGTVLRLTR